MSTKTPISIFCRIKPSDTHISNIKCYKEYDVRTDDADKDSLLIYNTQATNQTNFNHKPDFHKFQFSKVFDKNADQEDVYENVAKPVIHRALEGYNGTVFAYGQTGSGKTFTISGDKDNEGIVPRALKDIFTLISQHKNEEFKIQMSYLEIYNEQSNDLLVPSNEGRKKISLREGSNGTLEWHNLSQCTVTTLEDAEQLLAMGANNRIVGDTPMNIYSSRSHTVLTIYLTARCKETLVIRKAKLNLVDLAGSERVHKTGEEGLILEEARHINLSLHYLEQVIVALAEVGRSHVPYRNCTLTAALRDSLGGNCRTVMIANVTIDAQNYEETVSTCRFAQRVGMVRNELSVNTERDLVGENERLQAEIQRLSTNCNQLQAKVRKLEEERSSAALLEDSKLAALGNEVVAQCQAVKPSKSHTGGLSVNQLQTDIIYLVKWLQDELQEKHRAKSGHNQQLTSDCDESFYDFIETVADEKEWLVAKEVEKKTTEELTVKMEDIFAIHQDLLMWWTRNEKTLVREMLSGVCINLPCSNSKSVTNLIPESLSFDFQVEELLNTHSDLLKDFQLLKSRLQSAKRNLERIQRKYLVEFSNWKKSVQMSSDRLVVKPDTQVQTTKRIDNGSDDLHYETQHVNVENPYRQNTYRNQFTNKEKTFEDCFSEGSLSMCESDLNTTFDDLNSSILSHSTMTQLTDIRLSRPEHTAVRAVRSVPTSLQTVKSPRGRYIWTSATPTRPLTVGDNRRPIRLTGDQDIDDEIITFYRNKHLLK